MYTGKHVFDHVLIFLQQLSNHVSLYILNALISRINFTHVMKLQLVLECFLIILKTSAMSCVTMHFTCSLHDESFFS